MQLMLMVIIGIAMLLLLALLAVSLYRLMMVRAGGASVILRRVPAAPGAGWRHGVLRCRERDLVFFKLTSLKLGPDERIARQGIAIGERRSAVGSEFDIMTADTRIIVIGSPGQAYEVAFDDDGSTAFLAWVESRPSERLQRGRISRAS
nr:DUF2550 domain-containing protein [Millisia brevis]